MNPPCWLFSKTHNELSASPPTYTKSVQPSLFTSPDAFQFIGPGSGVDGYQRLKDSIPLPNAGWFDESAKSNLPSWLPPPTRSCLD